VSGPNVEGVRFWLINKHLSGGANEYREANTIIGQQRAEIERLQALVAEREAECLWFREFLVELKRRLGMNSEWFQRRIGAALDGEQTFLRSTADMTSGGAP
jgi:hypothetical protein